MDGQAMCVNCAMLRFRFALMKKPDSGRHLGVSPQFCHRVHNRRYPVGGSSAEL
ncbi:hypothetical protein O9993_17430 [Vibrio lentus]|nr:hypothetical protein [Vibrio lentus]